MLKKFILGYITGFAIMYYYLYHAQEDADAVTETFGDAATGYSGEKSREAADEILKK